MEELQAQIQNLTDFIASIREALGLAEDADATTITEYVTGMLDLIGENEAASTKAAADLESANAKMAKDASQVVVLSERLDASDEKATRLSTEVETLKAEKNLREADAAITLALQQGKLTPAEVDGADAPMRKLALDNRALFLAIVAKKPKGNLTLSVSASGDPAASAEIDAKQFWIEVRGKRGKDSALTSERAQDLVLAEHPEYKALFQTAAETLAAQRDQASGSATLAI